MNSARENIDYSYGDFAIPCCQLIRILRVISADFQSEKLVMLLLQVMTIKTNRKAKYYFNCRMKVDTSVWIFVETRDSLASVIFDTRNVKRVIRDFRIPGHIRAPQL